MIKQLVSFSTNKERTSGQFDMVMVSYCYKTHPFSSEMSVIDIAGITYETNEVYMTSDKERFGILHVGIIL